MGGISRGGYDPDKNRDETGRDRDRDDFSSRSRLFFGIGMSNPDLEKFRDDRGKSGFIGESRDFLLKIGESRDKSGKIEISRGKLR